MMTKTQLDTLENLFRERIIDSGNRGKTEAQATWRHALRLLERERATCALAALQLTRPGLVRAGEKGGVACVTAA